MVNYDKIKFKLILFSIITVSVLILSLYYANTIRSGKYNRITKKFQSVLLQKEMLADNAITDIAISLEEIEPDSLFIEDRFIEMSLKENIIFLVFGDSLIKYWTSNTTETYKPELYKSNFVFSSNAWFEVRRREIGQYVIFGLIKIHSTYTYENQYLENKFSDEYKIPENTFLEDDKSEYSIYNAEGEYLFSLKFPKTIQPNKYQSLIIISLYIITYILIILLLILLYSAISKYYGNKPILIFALIIDLLILRWILFYFQIPNDVYSLELFKPVVYASSRLFPSLGDLLVNSITLLAIAFVIFKNFKSTNLLNKLQQKFKFLISFSFLIFIFIVYYFLTISLTSIITDSTISFDLFNITTITDYSLIGLLCFCLLILSFVILFHGTTLAIIRILTFKKQWILVLLLIFGLLSFICKQFNLCDEFIVVFLLCYLIFYWFFVKSGEKKFKFSWALSLLILFSFYSTYITFQANSNIEKNGRRLLAQKLSDQRDFMAEYLFSEISTTAVNDSILINTLKEGSRNNDITYDEFLQYFRSRYFSRFWDKYDLLITICDSSKELNIQPDNFTINCFEYFDNLIDNFGIKTNYNNLTFLEFNESADNYIGIIDFTSIQPPVRIYIEVFSKLVPRGLGYPELLMDRKKNNILNLNTFSWARYENNEIVYHFGKYKYSTSFSNYKTKLGSSEFFNQNNYNHFIVEIDEDSVLIISKKNPGLIDIAAPFSYFFIFYGIVFGIIFIIMRRPFPIKRYSLNFKRRLQWSVVSLILFSFFIIGISSVFYIINLNNSKNTDLLSEKSHSVLIELEHKLAMEESLSPEMSQYLSELLYKLSLVFFSDINLYNLDGKLLATSRQEIITKGLISSQMNPVAYNQMNNYKNSLFIHSESIGEYKYLSAYLPFRNERNKPIAYLNLPYFAKQDDLSQEISTYLVAFINIYVIITSIAILITLIISNYISRPVRLIKEKIGRLKLGKQNEKIDWIQNDEIGSLVTEYNRMVDELARSAEQLAKSERESAWREMAKQIAHEIKNPLTPMKLSIQYLKRAWDEKTPDWDQRFARFTQTLVEQIDSLSKIATEFSDFAKMPKSKFEKLELVRVINNAISLYKDSNQVHFEFNCSEKHFVLADSEQLIRVFINLINNSIQAISDQDKGLIRITIDKKEGYHFINFSDNGKGIPSEQKGKVFYPNFTTKSGGMGLGLAMVKNIIQNSNGEIAFESEEGYGTTFIIKLPVLNE